MSAAKIKPPVPQEYLSDKPERERKYRLRGRSFTTRCSKMNEIFNFVARDTRHFQTLDQAPHIFGYSPELINVMETPVEVKALRTRLYWSTIDLMGYKPGDKKKIEIRTEEKIGKHYFEQVVKTGRDGGKTLERGEYKRPLTGFGVNMDVYPDKIREEILDILGKKECKPLVVLQGQSKPLLYHPDGRADVVFEIKFDKTVGRTFDEFPDLQAEVEIEIKEHPKTMSKEELFGLLDETEVFLFEDFADSLQPIFESKVAGLFRHLVGKYTKDPKTFAREFRELPERWWTQPGPS